MAQFEASREFGYSALAEAIAGKGVYSLDEREHLSVAAWAERHAESRPTRKFPVQARLHDACDLSSRCFAFSYRDSLPDRLIQLQGELHQRTGLSTWWKSWAIGK